jgi:hypothetical protein
MDRELLIELGCEEIPASWLASLTRQFGEHIAARLATLRLPADGPVETFSTPRRLTVRVGRIPERQTDLEDEVMGPPVSAAYNASGEPTPAAIGFAKKHGVDVGALQRKRKEKGEYLFYTKRVRGKAAVDVLPDVLTAALRDMTFPKQMRWDAWLDDGRGELLFGRPIRCSGGPVGGGDIRPSFPRDQRALGPRHQGAELRRVPGAAAREFRRARPLRAAQQGCPGARRPRPAARRQGEPGSLDTLVAAR